MRETYDSALLLSTRISFTADDCGAFDMGSSYVEESFVALRERVRGHSENTAGARVDSSPLPREWEPMWCDPGQDEASSSVFQVRTVRHHLKKIEEAAYS
jgi:hypothetical protein